VRLRASPAYLNKLAIPESAMTHPAEIKKENQLLIIGLTPSLLEKPVLWFQKKKKEIINKRIVNPWWRRNAFTLEKNSQIKPFELLRILNELGYVKTLPGKIKKGEFFIQGSVISIFPINEKVPWIMEFLNNSINLLEKRPFLKFEESASLKINVAEKIDTIKPGDYVVHIDHGIGIFKGIVPDAKHPTKYFKIEYAPPKNGKAPDILLVPLKQKQKIHLYLGLKNPTIHRLGTSLWQKTKKEAKENIIKFANELLASWQKRLTIEKRPALPDDLEREIWENCPFKLTKSQEKALFEILKDLEKTKPMERILAGDVGFGKTELAIRAALRTVLNGRQCAMLAPTTILANQHIQTFKERLKNLPVKISCLSRLQSHKQAKKIIQGIKEGGVDIIIGTHRMLSKDIKFKNLGLFIIDEEQRFGVKQKEAFKKQFPDVDILFLSATPIPRTLSLALSKIYSLSLLSESPPDKKSTCTFVLPKSEKIIKEAIKKELKKKGQIYYLAAKIKNIPQIINFLSSAFPKISKGILHGKLPQKEIADTMEKFRQGKIKILVSTTIIENGLDISNANTLIVEDASKLGLAEAHQIRGRIGRGFQSSFAYFLYTPNRLKEKSKARLDELYSNQKLGAGFSIAKKDLELRGAGNILGREQSGAAHKIGWNLYYNFLSETIENFRLTARTPNGAPREKTPSP
jgi:transcription-repair coupling factor (superfamily II helicase)